MNAGCAFAFDAHSYVDIYEFYHFFGFLCLFLSVLFLAIDSPNNIFSTGKQRGREGKNATQYPQQYFSPIK